MASIQPKFGYPGLKITYSAAEALLAGQIVERRTGTRLVGVAGAGSLVVAGVSRWDVPVTRVSPDLPQVGDGFETGVISNAIVPVTFAAAATVGQRLIAAASGQVTPAGATPDARTVIGYAFDAVGLGQVGLAYIGSCC